MFKKDFFLRIKNVQLKYVSSKAQINNTDYIINDNIMIMIIVMITIIMITIIVIIKKIIITIIKMMIKLCWGSTNYSVAQRIIRSVYA